MMLFDTTPADDMVIVPPEPDFAFQTAADELTYSNLYCYDGSAAGPDGGASTSASSSSSSSASSTTTPSSSPGTSFDAAGFEDGRRPPAREARADDGHWHCGDDRGNQDHDDAVRSLRRRDPRNGAFTFQVHAEYDLLLHVQRELDRRHGPSRERSTDIQLSRDIRNSIDRYCLSKQWMYHVGSEKGRAIGRFLREGAEDFRRADQPARVFTCVELGTYCGYSALVLASTLRQFALDLASSSSSGGDDGARPFEFRIYTTEVSSKLLNVAQSVFRLAKMERHVVPVLVKGDDDGGNKSPGGDAAAEPVKRRGPALSRTLSDRSVSRVDFLLLDHAKHLYLDDLRDLEDAGLLRAGSRVAADNVVFNRLDAYRDHVRGRAAAGVAESHLEEMNLEYSNNLKDGMEMTVYLKDPPRGGE